MYDEPPDSEPNLCSFCEHELGENLDCDHCKLAVTYRDEQNAHAKLSGLLHSRVRQLAAMPLYDDAGISISPRHMEAVGLLLALGKLPMPAEFIAHAAAFVTTEYGETGHTGRTDEELVAKFVDRAQWLQNQSAAMTYSADVLDRRPQTPQDTMTWGTDDNGVPRFCSHGEQRLNRDCHSSLWGATLRESIERALDSQAHTAEFWLEFFDEYRRPPKGELAKNSKVSYVVGESAYTAYVGKHRDDRWNSQGLGFGGSPFTVRLADGREFFTDNNWSRGTVPPRLRKLIASNAVFVRQPESEQGA